MTTPPTRYPLGRKVNHDPRSRVYALPELPSAAISSQTWKRRVPIMDQQNVGSCTGQAAAGWLGTDDSRRGGLMVLADGTPVDEALAVSIYAAAEELDGDGTVTVSDVGGQWSVTPDDGSSGLSVAKVLQARGLCTSYLHGFTLAAVYSALQAGPGLAGTTWYQSMFDTEADGHIKVDPSSGVAGGHEYVISKIVVESNGFVSQIWMDNSWGSGWGAGGSGWFTPDEFAALLADDGDFTAPAPVAVVPPTPAPVPPAPVPTPMPPAPAPAPVPGPTPAPTPIPPAPVPSPPAPTPAPPAPIPAPPSPTPAPVPPTGEAFFVADPRVVAHLVTVAGLRHTTPDAWLTLHLRHYFHLSAADDTELAGGSS